MVPHLQPCGQQDGGPEGLWVSGYSHLCCTPGTRAPVGSAKDKSISLRPQPWGRRSLLGCGERPTTGTHPAFASSEVSPAPLPPPSLTWGCGFCPHLPCLPRLRPPGGEAGHAFLLVPVSEDTAFLLVDTWAVVVQLSICFLEDGSGRVARELGWVGEVEAVGKGGYPQGLRGVHLPCS